MTHPNYSLEIMTTAKKINLFSIVLIAVTVLGITADILSKVIWFIGIMATVKKGEVFSELLEWRIRHVGIAMVVIYVCGWILSICMNIYLIGPMCSSVCCGVGFIIVSYIFELARNIKEDQEFMV